MQKPAEQKKHFYIGWLVAFFAPCLVLGIFAAWLGHGEFLESIGKNYSVFGKSPAPLDAWVLSAQCFLIAGVPAGLLGVAVLAIYRLLRRGSVLTKH